MKLAATSSEGGWKWFAWIAALMTVCSGVLYSLYATPSPRGLYLGRTGYGHTFLEMSYDFRQDRSALFSLSTASGLNTIQGTWRVEGDKVLFQGPHRDRTTNQVQDVTHVLHFDGSDLFNDNIVIRMIHQ